MTKLQRIKNDIQVAFKMSVFYMKKVREPEIEAILACTGVSLPTKGQMMLRNPDLVSAGL